jgi:Flp pilus assembly protein CpaB
MRFPSLRRKLPTSSVVWLFIAGALALTAFATVRSQVASAQRVQRAAGPMVAVVLASHDLAAGDVIAPGDVLVAQMPAVFAPPGAVAAVEQAVGAVSVGAVAEGEALVTTRLARSAFAGTVAPGNVAVTVGAVSVPAGFSTADRVDAFATYAGARPYTATVGEDLHVIAIGDPSSSVSGPSSTPVTLDVDPETARQILQAAVGGVLGLAVHPATTASPSPSAGWSPPPG